ncbi:hypothetical protein pb186bvf_015839 [Paramecium bursaria]
MAQKFKERLLQGSGVSNKKVESEYALKLMMKMGWNEGQGLGKNKDGQVECVQIKRREEQKGLGSSKSLGSGWDDQWWEQTYSQSLKNLKPISNQYIPEDDDEDQLSDYEKNRLKSKSTKVLSDSEEEDTFISIKKRLTKKYK